MVITFVMWMLIVERFIYFRSFHQSVVNDAITKWSSRTDRKSWHAKKVRLQLISNVRENTSVGLTFIATLVALCPMFGLLGTVTGMVEVFDVMAITGSSNPRAMAGGVSRATIPTMSGMVAALSGLYFSFTLARKAQTEVLSLADKLELDN